MAFYLLNTFPCMWYTEISLLSASYCDAMDAFIRKKIQEHNDYCRYEQDNYLEVSMDQLLEERVNNAMFARAGETMFDLVKRYVEHTDHIG